MHYNVVIIGGGLTGLVSAIQLAEQGMSCVIINSGQNVLSFSSGSLELLNQLPDGTIVQHPLDEITKLMVQAPQHPYSKLGESRFKQLTLEVPQLLARCGLSFQGDAQQNQARITPLGKVRASWLSPTDQLMLTDLANAPSSAIVDFNGFLDFQGQLAQAGLANWLPKLQHYRLELPLLNARRHSPSEFRSVNLTRIFESPAGQAELITQLQQQLQDEELVILPACFGLQQPNYSLNLAEQLDKKVKVLPTLPPVVLGLNLEQKLYQYAKKLGVIMMAGDTVKNADIQQQRVQRIYTKNHGDIAINGDYFILASGSFISRGLVAERTHIFEPIFNADVSVPLPHTEWYHPDFFHPQPYFKFGVCTTPEFNLLHQGTVLDNAYAAGSILSDSNALTEGCGGGVSTLTALAVAQTILQQARNEVHHA